MNRHLKILEFALSSLLRRKWKNISLLAIYALTIALLSSVLFLTDSLKREASLLLSGAPELIVQRLSGGRHELVPLSWAKEIGDIPGVGEVRPRVWGYYYDALTRSNYTLMGLETGGNGELALLDGSLPTAPGECAVGQGVAAARNAWKGKDLIMINSENIGSLCGVTGVFRSASNLLSNDLVVMPEADLRDFFSLAADRATDLRVQVYNVKEIDTIAGKIKRLYPDSRPITRRTILRTYDSVFSWRSGMLLSVFAAALIAFLILAWDKATGISGAEKQEIGILKAIGWETADVLELKFWEGIVISLTAFLVGVLAAYVHVFFLQAAALMPILKGWSILFPKFRMVPYVDLYQMVVVAFLTIVPYVACTVFPAWQAAVSDPESVMRS